MTSNTMKNKVVAFPTIKGKAIKPDELKEVNTKCISDIIDIIKELFPSLPIPDFPKPEEPNEPKPEEPKPEEPEDPKPTDPSFPDPDVIIPLGVTAVGASKMWEKGFKGEGILVGVIDSGINKHPDLDANVTIRRNYTDEDSEPTIEHGTHVAGTIAANGKIVGIAPNAKIAEYRALGSDGSGTYDQIAQAILDATDDGCHVINMSLGGPIGAPELKSAIDYATGNNVCVIAAAGNEGDGLNFTDEKSFPAMYSNVISVGSVNYVDYDKPSRFSNSNSQVDCCSHGEQVLSTGLDGNYIELTGTSMACPHVTGITALVIQEMIKEGVEIKTQDVYKKLLSYAKDVYHSGYDNSTGNGFITFNEKL